MAIRIIDDQPDIHLTRSEYDRLHREWQASQAMTAMPQNFESWLRACRVQGSPASTLLRPTYKVTANPRTALDLCSITSVTWPGLRVGKAGVEMAMPSLRSVQ